MSHLSRGGSLTYWMVTDGCRDGSVAGRKKSSVREKSRGGNIRMILLKKKPKVKGEFKGEWSCAGHTPDGS